MKTNPDLTMIDEYEKLRIQAVGKSSFSEPNIKSRLWELVSCGMAGWFNAKAAMPLPLTALPTEWGTGYSAPICQSEIITVLTDMTLSNIQHREALCIMR